MVHHMMGGLPLLGAADPEVRGASGDEDRPVGFDDPAAGSPFIGGMRREP